MRKLCLISALGILLLPALASAQNQFNGTWKTDMSKVDWSKKPDVYELKDGMYSCKTCTPAYTVKADGSDQKVTGHPYFDTIAIKVINDHEIEETDKKNGKVVGTSKTTVSADGNTLKFEFTDSSNTSGAAVTGKGEGGDEERTLPKRAHAGLSEWLIVKAVSSSVKCNILNKIMQAAFEAP